MRLTLRSSFRCWGLAAGPLAFGSQPFREVPDDRHDHLHRLVTVQPVFTESERLALAGFLAGYRGLTREAYTLGLRQFTAWCRIRSLSHFQRRQ